jgi:aspartyl-tRNA(Asn)/glutamyl-tRNA(Gln) amidotransferase subunit C
MKITPEEVLRVARLARLDIGAADIEKIAAQIGDILAYMDTLKRVDTEGLPPTTHAIALTNALREDQPRASLDPDGALANAPDREDDYFLVPKIIG